MNIFITKQIMIMIIEEYPAIYTLTNIYTYFLTIHIKILRLLPQYPIIFVLLQELVAWLGVPSYTWYEIRQCEMRNSPYSTYAHYVHTPRAHTAHTPRTPARTHCTHTLHAHTPHARTPHVRAPHTHTACTHIHRTHAHTRTPHAHTTCTSLMHTNYTCIQCSYFLEVCKNDYNN